MSYEVMEVISLLFGILSLFFLTAAVVIWFGFNIFNDVSNLTGLGAKRALHKMRRETKRKGKYVKNKKTKRASVQSKTPAEKDFEQTVLLKDVN